MINKDRRREREREREREIEKERKRKRRKRGREREGGIKRERERGRERLVIVVTAMGDCAHCSVISSYIYFACSAFRIIKGRIVLCRRVRPLYYRLSVTRVNYYTIDV